MDSSAQPLSLIVVSGSTLLSINILDADGAYMGCFAPLRPWRFAALSSWGHTVLYVLRYLRVSLGFF